MMSFESTNKLRIGSKVAIPGGGEAILKFVGQVKDKTGTFAGVELLGDSISKGKNSGNVNGVYYFETKLPNTGLFLPYTKLQQANGSSTSSPSSMISPSAMSRNTPSRLATTTSSNQTPIMRPKDSSSLPLSPSSQSTSSKKQKLVSTEHLESLNTTIATLTTHNDKQQQQLQQYEKQLLERTKILEDLQNTVSAFDSLMSDNERELKARDAKFAKYKENSDRQIAELIEVIEVLESQSRENEQLYLEKLNQFKKKSKVDPVKTDDACDDTKEWEKEKVELEKQLSLLKDTIAEKENDLKDMKMAKSKEVDKLRKFEMENYTLSMQIDDLKAKLAEQESGTGEKSDDDTSNSEKNESEIKSLRDSNDELKKLLEETEGKLKEAADSIQSLKDDQKELNGLKNELLEKCKEVSTLKEDLNVEKRKNIRQEQRIIELEKSLQQSLQKQNSETATTTPLKENIPLENIIQQPLVTEKGELKVFEPATKVDPTAGREKWCGLCEREGHESVECPYENMMF